MCAFSFAGARVNAKDNMWLTPLHRAVASRSEVSDVFQALCPMAACTVLYFIYFTGKVNIISGQLS